MKQGIIFIFLLFFSVFAFGQKGNIHGYIKEAATGDAMIGASIFLKGTSTGTVTDFNGEFNLNGLEAGEHILEISYLGFSSIEQTVSISGGTKEIEVLMEYEAVSMIGKDIVVTAQASAQMAAINKQRGSNTIANVISVKRIQELPDANAAEVVGRLPGVSLQREGGEGAKVVIRGLAPKYNKVTIEGVKMASTGGDDRSSDMSMISPYMLEGIEVFKAAMPDKEADVHGGSINFILKEAPNEFKLDALVLGGYNSIPNKIGTYKTVLGASNRFFKNKLGLFIQGDFESRQRQSHGLKASYNTTDFQTINTTLMSFTLLDVNRDVNRKGGVVVLDYKLPTGKIKLSSFGSSISKDFINRRSVFAVDGGFHSYQMDIAKTNLFILTNSLSITNTFGPFDVDGVVSYSLSKNEVPKSVTLTAREDDAFKDGIKRDSSNAEDAINFAKYDYPQAILDRISRNSTKSSENETAYSLNVAYNYNPTQLFSFKFKVGGKYKKLNKKYDQNRQYIPIPFGGLIGGDPFRAAVAENIPSIKAAYGDNPSDLGYHHFVDNEYINENFLKGKYTFQGTPKYELVKLLDEIAGDGSTVLYKTDYPNSIMRDYSGNERYIAAYLMSEIKIAQNITIIPGVRYEENSTAYTANRGNGEAQHPFEGYEHYSIETKRANSFWLPMVQAKYTPTKWLDIRAAYTKTLSRPNFNEITPFWHITLLNVSWNNPFLRPSVSTNLDLSVSAYHNKLGFLSIGGFKKEVKDLIFFRGSSVIFDPSFYGLEEKEGGKRILSSINNTFPLNLWGIESEWKTRFWYLDNFLKGFVMNLNYTHTFSNVKYPRSEVTTTYSDEPPYIVTTSIDTFYSDRFLLQPNDIFNATIGYDLKGFSTRLSYLYRSNVFAKTSLYPDLRAESANYSRWDLSFKQTLPKGLEILLNFGNLSSFIERDLLVNKKFPINEQDYGRTIDLALRFRL